DSLTPKRPVGASLLGRLWDHMPAPLPPEASDLTERVDAATRQQGGRLLVRMALDSMPPATNAAVAAAASSTATPWQWQPEAGDESVIGTVAHAWLERLGTDGGAAWPAHRLNS